ncbi:MAG: hypothetical protein KDA81_10125 [Planctomycetaceae bacterium]|nr:hypothetical protein [Planctomycetaceae bacterium]
MSTSFGPPDDFNPYRAPDSMGEPAEAGETEAERIRRQYLSHEASVKSIGSLFLLGGLMMVLGIGAAVFASARPAADLILLVALGTLGLVQCIVAVGLSRLKPWARIVGAFFCGLGMLWIPIGTLINLYFLYLLLGKKGKYIFSPEYRTIIDQTPHVRYRTSIIVWIFVLILVVTLLMGIGAALFL